MPTGRLPPWGFEPRTIEQREMSTIYPWSALIQREMSTIYPWSRETQSDPPMSRLLSAAEALYWCSRNLLRKVAMPAMTAEKQHWERTSIRKNGLSSRRTSRLGNTGDTHTRKWSYTHTHFNIYIHTGTSLYIHTCIHTHKHTYKLLIN